MEKNEFTINLYERIAPLKLDDETKKQVIDIVFWAMDKKCEWWTDGDTDVWETGCGKRFELIAGTPSDNKMKFCPYCGGQLITEEKCSQNYVE